MERFYQIVDSADWLTLFLPLGLKLVQLRMKEVSEEELRFHAERAQNLCAEAGAVFILNDAWKMAIALGVPFVHLGQEDLQGADIKALRRAGIKLGISTHSEEELEIALQAAPDYIALGPIYPTILKKMSCPPQGLERIGIWQKQIRHFVGPKRKPPPLVAIGGITLDRAPGVFAAGADSVCVVTDVLRASDPCARLRGYLSLPDISISQRCVHH